VQLEAKASADSVRNRPTFLFLTPHTHTSLPSPFYTPEPLTAEYCPQYGRISCEYCAFNKSTFTCVESVKIISRSVINNQRLTVLIKNPWNDIWVHAINGLCYSTNDSRGCGPRTFRSDIVRLLEFLSSPTSCTYKREVFLSFRTKTNPR